MESKGFEFEKIDISTNTDLRTDMREKMGDPKALPPRLFFDDEYLGGLEEFEEAIDSEALEQFLKIKA